MATLYLDHKDLELRSNGSTIALYRDGAASGHVPLRLLERVVIQGSQTRLDSGVLLRLAEGGASVVFLSPRMGRRVATVLGPAHNDAAVRLAQAQRVMDPEFCLDFARSIVGAKIRRQRRTLDRLLIARPDARRQLFGTMMKLARASNAAQGPKITTPDALRGIEGAAAREYFRGLAAVFPPSAKFNGRNRRPPRDPVNACLSLGYTLLHSDAVLAAHAAGLDPLLGFYHRPAFGRESLACDLMDPLRPVVDAWVWAMWRDRELREEHFTLTNGACLLAKSGRQHFFASWEENARWHRRWLRRQTSAMARQLRAEGLPLLDGGDEDPFS
ncbi:MAG TPA: CRISPR-associated endonuclease Cas1 [Gammaproteobacteria bacterium]|nr:CRISPR-associated endonuclease Cas1 [Gammaproteobacteria bacterium]